MNESWECARCDFVTDSFNKLWDHYDNRHRQLLYEQGKRFRAMTPERQYQCIMARRVRQIKEIQQFKIDATSFNDNFLPHGEEPIDVSWCDELLQKVIEMIPRKPK